MHYIAFVNSSKGTNCLLLGPFILAIFFAPGDCFMIKWVLNPIEKFVAKESQEHKKLAEHCQI